MVIATVFLTIIGMTLGYLLGERHRNEEASRSSQPTGETTPATSESPTGAAGPACPDEAIQTAAELGLPTDLRQVFKIVTASGTVVWICQDGNGSLYYQGKTPRTDGKLIQGKNGLFLTQVVREGEDEYEATAENGNVILVNRKVLEVRFASGDHQVSTVETAE